VTPSMGARAHCLTSHSRVLEASRIGLTPAGARAGMLMILRYGSSAVYAGQLSYRVRVEITELESRP
jgi:hypothetical protein